MRPRRRSRAQVVGHAARTVILRGESAQRGHRLAQFAVAESLRQQVEL